MSKKEAKPMYVPQKVDVVSVDCILRIEVQHGNILGYIRRL